MRTLAMLTAVTLLGGCSALTAPPRQTPPEPEPVQAPEPPPAPAARTAPAPTSRAAPRPPRPVKIDNTSIQSFRATWQRLSASLSPAQRTDLNDAVARLALESYPGLTDVPKNLSHNPIVPEMIRDQIHGLGYAEIVALSR